MSASLTHTAPQDDPGPPAAGTHGHGEALNDLINMGTDIARRLHGHAMAQPQPAQQATIPANQPPNTQSAPAPAPAPPPAPEALIRIAASFDQIARAVRRCIALKQSPNDSKQQPAKPPTQDRTIARKRIIRAIEDVILRPPDNDECDDPEVLLSDFRERMDTPDLEDDIASRPAEDIIKEILRDLGLAALPGSRPWKRRTPADIADLNASAAAPSRPRQPAAGPGPQDGHPAAPARPPVRPGDTLPKDPAGAVAFVLHHHARPNARWRPPPGD